VRTTTRRILTAAAVICSALTGAFASTAQATGPGTGSGLVPLVGPDPDGSIPCTAVGEVTYYTFFLVPGAQNAAMRGTGAATAPFPGFLVSSYNYQDAPPLPTGTWQLLPGGIPGRIIGHKKGLQSPFVDCPFAPTGPGQ
jgi:hypothetical protein